MGIRNTLELMLVFKVCRLIKLKATLVHSTQPSFLFVHRWDMEGSGILHRDGGQQFRPVSGLSAVMEEACTGPHSCSQVSGAMLCAGL